MLSESCLRDICQSYNPFSDTGRSRTVESDLTAIGTSLVNLIEIFALPTLSLRVRPNML
jgi:hypothetical protein